MKIRSKQQRWAIAVVFALTSPLGALAAQTTANFDTDSFPDAAGDGWVNAWAKSGGTATIVNTTPLDGGDNYLSFVPSGIDAIVSREYTDNGDVLTTGSHTIEWDFRLDKADLSTFTANTDRVTFFGRNGQQLTADTNNTDSWIIIAAGTASGLGAGTAPVTQQFGIYDRGPSDDFSSSNVLSSGIPLIAGDVYHMAVTLHPTEKTYSVVITDVNTGQKFGSSFNHEFRNQSSPGSQFTDIQLGTKGSASGENPFSLDALSITKAPAIKADFYSSDETFDQDSDGFATAGSGDGWNAGWGYTGGGSGTTTTTAPLSGTNDPYLKVTQTGTGLVRRQMTNYDDVDLSKQHMIEWTWRYDGTQADVDAMNNFNNRINFFGDDSLEGSTSASNSWLIGVVGADSGGNDVFEKDWYFFDNNGSTAFNKTNMVDVGFGLTAGATYSFKVILNPNTGTYSAYISDGVNSFWADNLTYRNGLTNFISNELHFGINANTGSDVTSFSLDSVHITALPAPAALPAGLALMGMLVGRRRR
ncbi:MAG: hypothetical protein GC162_08695 [Planctomycetes bacterium]|nr:hypothetical protein [Planctomycetota bacterium]